MNISVEQTIINIVKKHLNGRKIILYGNSDSLAKLIESESLGSVIVATGVREKVTDILKFIFDYKEQNDKYYIIVPFLPREQNHIQRLENLGYSENIDFIFQKAHKPIILKNIDGEYRDEYNNIIYGSCKNCNISISGYNNTLDFRGSDITDSTIKIGNNCSLILKKTIFTRNKLEMFNDSFLSIDENSKLSSGTILIRENANLKAGKKTRIWFDFFIDCAMNSTLNIGDDCTISAYFKAITADGHSIFNVDTKENINSTKHNKFHSINIGEHIWIGMDVFLIGNCTIDNGCIIGARSLVKGKFPNNCIIAGVPAKIIATNRCWSRINAAEDISVCEPYIHTTRLSNNRQTKSWLNTLFSFFKRGFKSS